TGFRVSMADDCSWPRKRAEESVSSCVQPALPALLLLPRFASQSALRRPWPKAGESPWKSYAAEAARPGSRCCWRSTMRRVMCMYFPKWPLQRLCCERPELRDKPVAIIGQGTAARGPQILLVSMLANRSGIRTDMPVAEAMAIQPQLSTVEVDPDRDRFA